MAEILLHDDGFRRLIELSSRYSANFQYPCASQLVVQLSPDGVTFLRLNALTNEPPIIRLHVESHEFATLVQAYQSYLADRETADFSSSCTDENDDLDDHPF